MRNSRISSNSAYGQFWHKSTDGARPGRHGAPGHGNDRAVGVHGSALHHTGGGGGGGGGVRGRIREAQAFNESGEESMLRATPPPPSFVGSAGAMGTRTTNPRVVTHAHLSPPDEDPAVWVLLRRRFFPTRDADLTGGPGRRSFVHFPSPSGLSVAGQPGASPRRCPRPVERTTG